VIKPRLFFYALVLAFVFMLGRLAGVPTGSPHRLSGHPSSLAGKLVLAKRQVQHDRSPGLRHWVGRDRVYVSQLRRLLFLSVLPPHYAGWSCITNGAYPGAPHEGNGYNGRYSGPLGMSTPWMGFYPPGRDWVHSSVVSVYWIAERVAARYGFAYAFMRGQWPNTYPPCAGRF
jgi:hypothetical protein